jgi:DNA-binding MarR family transcriptional regulator
VPRTQQARRDEENGAADTGYAAPTFRSEEALGYCLRRAQVSVFQKFLSTFEDVQLRPVEFSILTLIQDNPGRKQTEISHALGIKRANFVPIIDALEARDLVERRPSAEDRRANALYLTRAGIKFILAVHKRHDALEGQFTLRLGGQAKRTELLALLRLLA